MVIQTAVIQIVVIQIVVIQIVVIQTSFECSRTIDPLVLKSRTIAAFLFTYLLGGGVGAGALLSVAGAGLYPLWPAGNPGMLRHCIE